MSDNERMTASEVIVADWSRGNSKRRKLVKWLHDDGKGFSFAQIIEFCGIEIETEAYELPCMELMSL